MKLLKCHIENFGKLNNFEYEFTSGLNIIKEPNGFGKTTFANFIKAMFYGLESTAKRTTALTDRKKYYPWQGGNFGGSIEFEIDGQEYRVERFFGQKEQEDTFELYNLKTNLKSTDFTKNLGEEIFKINKEAYERSTYIPSKGIQIKMNDSLNAKLGNILESEKDINTSEMALKRIDDAVKIYKKTGLRGLLNENQDKIIKLQRMIEEKKSEEEAYEERKAKLEETKNKIKEVEKIQKQAREELEKGLELEGKIAKKQNYELLRKKYEENLKMKKELDNFFKGEVPKDEEIDVLFDKCIQVEKYRVEVKGYDLSDEERLDILRLKEKFENKNMTERKINQKIADCNEIKDVKNKIENISNEKDKIKEKILENQESISSNRKRGIILLIISIVFIIASLGTFFFNILELNIARGIFIFSIILITVSISKFIKSRKLKKEMKLKKEEKENVEEVLNGLNSKLYEIENDVNEFLSEYLGTSYDEDKVIALTEVRADLNKYHELERKLNSTLSKQFKTTQKLELLQDSIKKYLEKYFEKVKEPYSKLAQEMRNKKNEFNTVTISLEQSKKEKEEFEKENEINQLNDIVIDSDFKESNNLKVFDKVKIEEKIRNAEIQINLLNSEKISNKNQMELLETSIDELEEKESELEELQNAQKEYEEKYEILKKTEKYLKQAKESFSSHYLNRMEKGFNKYMKLIDNNEINANIDVNLNVKLEKNGSKKDSSYFSTGYQDLIYICIRFGLIDALFENESPFVVLDDPFVNFDENKIENSIDLINKISEKYQIVYFVCHESRT